MTLPFSLFEIRRSAITPSTALHAFCSGLHSSTYLSLSVFPSPHTVHLGTRNCLVDSVSFPPARCPALLYHLFQRTYIPSDVPLPFLNHCCSSPNSPSTRLLIIASKTLSNSFNTWLSSVMPLYFPGSCTSPFLFHIGTIRPILHSFGILPSCIDTFSSLPVHLTPTSPAISNISSRTSSATVALPFFIWRQTQSRVYSIISYPVELFNYAHQSQQSYFCDLKFSFICLLQSPCRSQWLLPGLLVSLSLYQSSNSCIGSVYYIIPVLSSKLICLIWFIAVTLCVNWTVSVARLSQSYVYAYTWIICLAILLRFQRMDTALSASEQDYDEGMRYFW